MINGAPERNIGPVEKIRTAIRTIVDDAVRDLHTAIPGEIVSYDSSTQRATVKVSIKRATVAGATFEVPEITEAPVVFPRSGEYQITYPLAAGDGCLILFSERSLDTWKPNGGTVEPSEIVRFHDYTDALVLPGLCADCTGLEVDSGDEDALVIQSSSAKVVLASDGRVYIGKRGATPSEATVLGDVLASGLESILNSISTGPIGVDTSTGATIATHPTLQTAISNWISTYITTAATNIKSQRTFVDRGA